MGSHSSAACFRIVALLLCVTLGVVHAQTRPSAPDAESVQRLRTHISYLASDKLEGRGVGTRGLDLAADYIANQFRELGLRPPPGQDSYFQKFGGIAAVPVTRPTTMPARPPTPRTRTPRLLSSILGGEDDGASYPTQSRRYEARNVIAYLPGRGPRANEYIVVGAHYDHLGMRLRRPSARPATTAPSLMIWHGADDNASGVAAMFEIARTVQKAQPERSILFIAFAAEEQGLVGSRQFVENPLVPLDRIVAMINIDMVGRLRARVLFVSGMGTSAAFRSIVHDAARRAGLLVFKFSDRGEGGSDQWSFVEKSIPVLFFCSGPHGDFHEPTDTADQINYSDESLAVQMIADVAIAIAREPDPRFIPPARPTSRPATRRF